MTVEYTLSIIKPDATQRNLIGKINSYLESAGLKIVAQKMVQLTADQAKEFYAEHSHRPFFPSLVEIMTSAPVVLQVLKGENAIMKNREVMGATNPADAAPGTIRKDFAQSIDANSVHGSDSSESAAREIKYFFTKEEILG
jgi:nucleoside-diphosphate kinase